MTFDTVGALPVWFEDAACRDMASTDHDPWFPEGQGASPAAAKAVCDVCLVRADCAAYADAHGFRDGVWGGLSR